MAGQGLPLWKALRAAGFRLILPFASRSQVAQRVEVDRAWVRVVRDRFVELVELLRASERASPRWVRGSLRAMDRPEVPEGLPWPAAGPIAMTVSMTATRNRRIHRDYRRNTGIALERDHLQADWVNAWRSRHVTQEFLLSALSRDIRGRAAGSPEPCVKHMFLVSRC